VGGAEVRAAQAGTPCGEKGGGEGGGAAPAWPTRRHYPGALGERPGGTGGAGTGNARFRRVAANFEREQMRCGGQPCAAAVPVRSCRGLHGRRAGARAASGRGGETDGGRPAAERGAAQRRRRDLVHRVAMVWWLLVLA
jgi:hypothetical protein